MADLEIGADSNLTTTLTTTDRITITRAATSQKVATMTVGNFMEKCADMIRVVSSTSRGLVSNATFPLYRAYGTLAQAYPALLIKTDIPLNTTGYTVAHLDIADILSWNYGNQISAKVKARMNLTSPAIDVKDFSSASFISSVIMFYESNFLNIQINFKSAVNISVGFVVANCIAQQGNTANTINHITSIERAEVYTGGKYTYEKLSTVTNPLSSPVANVLTDSLGENDLFTPPPQIPLCKRILRRRATFLVFQQQLTTQGLKTTLTGSAIFTQSAKWRKKSSNSRKKLIILNQILYPVRTRKRYQKVNVAGRSPPSPD